MNTKQLQRLDGVKDREILLNVWSQMNTKYTSGKSWTDNDAEKWDVITEKMMDYNNAQKQIEPKGGFIQ